jgi:hypothetical protein
MPLTTPEMQRVAAEAARAEGDKNPKTDPKEEINMLEKQIAELKEKQAFLTKPVPEPMAENRTVLQENTNQNRIVKTS